MTPEQSAAFVNSQVACALAEIEMMKAANHERLSSGEALAYNDESFAEIQDRFGIGRNAVVQVMRNSQHG